MRVLVAVLVLGIAGCGGDDNSPDDVAAPSSAAISPVKSENAAAGAPKTKADELPVQAAAEQKAAAKKSVEGREPLTLEGHSDWVLSVSFSPDGQRLACARDGSLEVWDVHSLTKSK